MFNPITLVGLIIVLGICFLAGLFYQIPTTPTPSISVNGQATRAVYQNFISGSSSATFDSRAKLDIILNEAEYMLSVQEEDSCFEFTNLQAILDDIVDKNVVTELKKYQANPANPEASKYVASNNVSELQTIASNLHNFVENLQSLSEYYTRLIITTQEFATLKDISDYWVTATNLSGVTRVLDALCLKIGYFDTLQTYRTLKLLNIDNSILAEFEEKYITKTKTKLANIRTEMERLYNEASNDYYISNLKDLKNLITNYKVIVTSAKTAIQSELGILLRKVSGSKKIFNNQNLSVEDMKINLEEAKFYLTRDGLYYKQYQHPLNFGSASSSVTAYDHCYFIVSIVGFMTIVFGIFCAYKLFGKDRKSGKLDLLLAQKVKFGEVFAGKFFAIFFCTGFILASFTILSFIWGSILYAFLPNSIFAVFNLQSGYTIAPLFFLLLKVVGIELQVVFWVVVTIFMMNMSRKFELFFGLSLLIFALATAGNILFNDQFWYCLLPFVHVDLTAFLGGATMQSGFLVSALYVSGNFYISLAYYVVVVCLVYNFTNQLFKKN